MPIKTSTTTQKNSNSKGEKLNKFCSELLPGERKQKIYKNNK
jgi:hypothetical protein